MTNQERDALRSLSANDIARFWSYVQKTETCWLWVGAKGKGYDTYGRFNIGGRAFRAHRVAYQMVHSCQLEKGVELRHTCDVPACVNPAHLVPSTHAENMADMKAKGRSNGPRRGITHCLKGHELAGSNLIIRPNGNRLCAVCRKETERRWNAIISERRQARRRGAA